MCVKDLTFPRKEGFTFVSVNMFCLEPRCSCRRRFSGFRREHYRRRLYTSERPRKLIIVMHNLSLEFRTCTTMFVAKLIISGVSMSSTLSHTRLLAMPFFWHFPKILCFLRAHTIGRDLRSLCVLSIRRNCRCEAQT